MTFKTLLFMTFLSFSSFSWATNSAVVHSEEEALRAANTIADKVITVRDEITSTKAELDRILKKKRELIDERDNIAPSCRQKLDSLQQRAESKLAKSNLSKQKVEKLRKILKEIKEDKE